MRYSRSGTFGFAASMRTLRLPSESSGSNNMVLKACDRSPPATTKTPRGASA
jgi:hypothetical protein